MMGGSSLRGTVVQQAGLTRDEAQLLSNELARVFDVPECSIATLGSLPAPSLLAALNAVNQDKRCGEMPWQPVIDGDLLPDSILNCWKAGSAANLDAMVRDGRAAERNLVFFLDIFHQGGFFPPVHGSAARTSLPILSEVVRRAYEVLGWAGWVHAG
jgi:hypothetical protein